MLKEETKFVDQEIQETLRKGLIYLTKKSGSIFKHFLVAKKMGKPSGTQPERIEQISSIGSFQKGRVSSC